MLNDAAAHRRLVREWLVAGALGIAIALVAGTALRTFVLGAVVVPSRSMCDTVIPGDRLLVSKLVVPRRVDVGIPFTGVRCQFTVPPLRPLRVGDVLVVRPPGGWIEDPMDRTAYLVKRCAGMPGDTLVFDHDVLMVN
ncbi:partial signal peptidase I, partial [Anaerolineae bacterium]